MTLCRQTVARSKATRSQFRSYFVHRVVALVVLNNKETAMHDDFMSTNCCSLKGNKIPNQIKVWTKGSLRSTCSTHKRLQCSMTPRRSTHNVGLIPSVPGHTTHRFSSKAVVEFAPMCSKTHSVCSAKHVGSRNNNTVARVHHMRTNRSNNHTTNTFAFEKPEV